MTIAFYLSGGQANALPSNSLGGVISTTPITSAILDNLFGDITRAQGLLGQTDYRCIYIKNTGATEETGVVVTITWPVLTTIQVGIDQAGQGDGINNGVAQIIDTPLTVPSNVTFYGDSYLTVSLTLGTLKPGVAYPLWFARTSQAGIQGLITFTINVNTSGNSLPTGTAPFGADGVGVGEIANLTTQATGTFLIGTARIGFADMA